MRKVLRNKDAFAYWNHRWSNFERDDNTFHNLEIYPIKYVDPVLSRSQTILELGCGLGRVLKHYHGKGYQIMGCDFSPVAVEKLKETDPDIDVRVADTRDLPYGDHAFDTILALGVFHSIERISDIAIGLQETWRCLRKGGTLVASVRSDNFENHLIDWTTSLRGQAGTIFHKWCFKRTEFADILEKERFTITDTQLVTNVPFLHKFKVFRKYRECDEKVARSHGFQLNTIGSRIYRMLKLSFPESFGTTWVFYARKESME